MPTPNYSPAYVTALFNDMAKTYGTVNLVSSLGFSHLWRKACVDTLAPESHHICADLMCGMGEAATLMLQAAGSSIQIDVVDFCPEMTKRCSANLNRLSASRCSIRTEDALELSLSTSFDRLCCSFGLKTLDDEQTQRFSRLIHRLLKTGGRAAFVEIYVPSSSLLRAPYLFYIRHVIPFIGRICLGNPNCYRNLARYTEDFVQRDRFAEYLRDTGLVVATRELFFGCAKLYVAEKSG